MSGAIDVWPRPGARWRRHPQGLLSAIFLCSLALGSAALAWPAKRALLREQAEAERLASEVAPLAVAPPSPAGEEVAPILDSTELLAAIAAAAERGGLQLESLVAAPMAAREDGAAALLRLSAAGDYGGVADFFRRLGALPWPVVPRWLHLAPASPTASAPLRLQAELAVCCAGAVEP